MFRPAPLLLATLLLSTPAFAQRGSTLATGATLNTGEYLVSDNRQFFALMQGDGNFCLYKGSSPSASRGNVWCNTTQSRSPGSYVLEMQADGNLCSSWKTSATTKRPVWCALGSGQAAGSYHAKLADDGDLSVYTASADGAGVVPLWSTNTAVRPLAYDQQICFVFSSGVQARGYLWWAVGGQTKSYDTGAQFMININEKCMTLPQGSTAHTIRVTYNRAQAGAWPKACEMTILWLPVTPSPALVSEGPISVLVKGALGNVHCRTCVSLGNTDDGSNCANHMPINR